MTCRAPRDPDINPSTGSKAGDLKQVKVLGLLEEAIIDSESIRQKSRYDFPGSPEVDR